MTGDIKVSIVCNVYNHENYLRKALESFVSQKTNFAYEVLIHDDASTDHSAEIIKEFEEKYPQIIKPIYQTENQWSKGIHVTNVFQYPRAEGEYIAFCEGDDYWIDDQKLQKQADYMDSHPDCAICFTNGLIEDMVDGSFRDFIPYNEQDRSFYKDENREYTLHNMYELSFVPTASYFYRKSTCLYTSSLYQNACPTGDLKIRLYLMTQGYAYYLKDKTCVYRQNVPNSAMTKWKKQSREKAQKHNNLVLSMLNHLDVFTEGAYSEGLFKIKESFIIGLLFSATSFGILKDPLCKRVYQSFSAKKKIKFIIKVLTPEWGLRLREKLKKKG